MTTVLVVDDQPLIRSGLRSVLESAEITVIGEAGNGEDALAALRRTRAEVVLMDLRMPGVDGVEATRAIRADEDLRDVAVLVLTTFDGDREIVSALAAGADGFLGKSAEPDELIAAVLRTAEGESALSAKAARAVVRHLGEGAAPPPTDPRLAALTQTLTPRERDIVAAAATGDDNEEIAAALVISPHTVKTHLNRAMVKLGARNRGQLVAMAYRSGIARA